MPQKERHKSQQEETYYRILAKIKQYIFPEKTQKQESIWSSSVQVTDLCRQPSLTTYSYYNRYADNFAFPFKHD